MDGNETGYIWDLLEAMLLLVHRDQEGTDNEILIEMMVLVVVTAIQGGIVEPESCLWTDKIIFTNSSYTPGQWSKASRESAGTWSWAYVALLKRT